MATSSKSTSLPPPPAKPPGILVTGATVIPAPTPLRLSNSNMTASAKALKESDEASDELESILLHVDDEPETAQDEEMVREEHIPWGSTPSPAPGTKESEFPFSPPTRTINPMIQNSPFQRDSVLDQESPPGAPASKPSPISPREAFRRRRMRSMSCPEKDTNLVTGEA